MLRNTVIAILMLTPVFGSAQCAATYSYSANCLTVQFTGIITPPGSPNVSYYWWFSDGNNSSTQLNPTYTFSGGGTYMVCFSFYDPATSCGDSICMPVNVSPCGCSADFTWMDTLGYTYFLGNSTAGAGANYYWDFGDGNNSTQQYPWYQYANPGTYTVCLTAYDSNMVFCDSTCHTVVVASTGGCHADFTWIDSLGYVFFLSSTTAGSGAIYFWDFGDGNYDNTMNPSHVYSAPGMYTVCLTVYDSMQVFCDSTCYTVTVQSVGVEEDNLLEASLSVSPNPADELLQLSFMTESTGEANVTFFDAAGRNTFNETFVHNDGHVNTRINTTNMPQGIYLVKIEVNGFVAWKKIALTHQ